MYLSLRAINAIGVSANSPRELEVIFRLLTSVADKAREMEESMGDPGKLARSIVDDDVAGRVRYNRTLCSRWL